MVKEMNEPEDAISKIAKMPENLAKGLTGKRREIFEAVQNGEVES
jgi:hypothetical protein